METGNTDRHGDDNFFTSKSKVFSATLPEDHAFDGLSSDGRNTIILSPVERTS